MPRPSSSWTAAKVVFSSARWPCTRCASQVIGRAMKGGLSAADDASIWANALVYMNGWNWSTPSSSHIGREAELERPRQVQSRHGGLRLAGLPAPRSGTADDDLVHRPSPPLYSSRAANDISTIEARLLGAQ